MNDYDQSKAFGGVIDVLETIGAQCAFWGGLAVVAYGEPRLTHDMDILLSSAGFAAAPFVRRLQENHYLVDDAAVNRALSGGFFRVIQHYYQIKTDFYVSVESELQVMVAERVYLPFDHSRRAAYLSPTAVVISKLQVYREGQSTRHLDDIASIVRLQGDKSDGQRLDVAAARLGLMGVWRAVWQQNRPY